MNPLGQAPEPVRALFFAAYRDLVGRGEMELEVGPETTVSGLVQQLRRRGAPFDALPPEPVVAVNRVYAFPSDPVRGGDEVAFIPPVAGG